MRTDNDGCYIAASAYYCNADSANVTQTASQGWFWAEPWSRWEREAEADMATGRCEAFDTDAAFLASLEEPPEVEYDVVVRMPPKRRYRYAQPLVLFLPLALWRWLLRKVRYR